jgi:hypothetical protein
VNRTTPRRPRAARTTATAAALALALGLGACSAGGDQAAAKPVRSERPSTTAAAPGRDATTTTTEAGSPTTTEPADEPADHPEVDEYELDDARDRVERINLTADDLPDDWVSEDPIDEVGSVVEDCSTSGAADGIVAKAASDRFSLIEGTGGLTLDTTSGYLVDEDAAADLTGEIGSEDFAACATETLLSAEGVTVEGALHPYDGAPALADETVALQGDFTMSDQTGRTIHLSALIFAIRTDQVVTTVSATAIDTPGNDQLLADVLSLVAERQET